MQFEPFSIPIQHKRDQSAQPSPVRRQRISSQEPLRAGCENKKAYPLSDVIFFVNLIAFVVFTGGHSVAGENQLIRLDPKGKAIMHQDKVW